jgi:ABC-type transporter Mla MlaB component
MSTEHALPAELTIYNVGELLPRFKAALPDDAGVLRMQASAVAEVDAAGIQLLLSLARTTQSRNARMELVDASPGLSAACEALGVSGLLTWTSEGAPHAQ